MFLFARILPAAAAEKDHKFCAVINLAKRRLHNRFRARKRAVGCQPPTASVFESRIDAFRARKRRVETPASQELGRVLAAPDRQSGAAVPGKHTTGRRSCDRRR